MQLPTMNQNNLSFSEFQSLAVRSADIYLDYLSNTTDFRGKKVVSVEDISCTEQPHFYIFTISEKLPNPDSCQIWIDERYCEQIKIAKTCSTTGRRFQILVHDQEHFFKLPTLSPHRVKIISDMRFLIKRLRDFYNSNKFSFSPDPTNLILPPPELPEEFLRGLSDEQISAISGVFNSTLSYVCGAPGTGKTNKVLSRCVLRYALAGERVFLLAPTNNAVEQMLRGILPTLHQAGIPLEKVYRFGTTSEEFAREYPQVIGDHSAELLIAELLQEHKILQQKLEAVTKLEEVYQEKQKRFLLCSQACEAVRPIVDKIRLLVPSLVEQKARYSETVLSYNDCFSNQATLEKNCQQLSDRIEEVDKLLAEKNLRIQKFYVRVLRRREYTRLSLEIAHLHSEKEKAQNLLSAKRKQSLENSVHCRDLLVLRDQIASDLTNGQQQNDELVGSVKAIMSADPMLAKLLSGALSLPDIPFAPFDNLLNELAVEVSRAKAHIGSQSSSSLSKRLSEIKKELVILQSGAKQEQRKNALILSSTIDSALSFLIQPSDTPSHLMIRHVFLDEAGYTSLIRGMVAFACGAPITLLGDHKQLPPVCEMNRIPPEASPVCLWTLPVVYLSEILQGNLEDLYTYCYRGNRPPSFDALRVFYLNTSYRFGPELAQILDSYIYKSGLCGAGASQFHIEVINAPYKPGVLKRSNSAEAIAIADYVSEVKPTDFIVLTPYLGQVKQLKQTLPPKQKDSVLTVHRSQGREWETVIFSVTDNYPSKFFVNSSLPIGQQIINTAISRSKSKLVLVCDASSWQNHSNQIISDLLMQATEHIDESHIE